MEPSILIIFVSYPILIKGNVKMGGLQNDRYLLDFTRCSVDRRKVPSNPSATQTHHLSLSLLPPTMASFLQNHLNSSLSTSTPNLHWTPNLHPSPRRPHFSAKPRVLTFRVTYKCRLGVSSFRCFCSSGTELQNASLQQRTEPRPFDINLAVILAGFAFEAYTSPPVI